MKDRQILSVILLLIFSFGLTSCVSTTEIYRDEVRVRTEKLPCPADCPEYILSLYGDGWANFEGFENVGLKGEFRKFIGKETIDSLIVLFDETAFFTLPQELPRSFGSKQDVILSLKMGKYYNEVLYPETGAARFKKIDHLLKMVSDDLTGWEKVPNDSKDQKTEP